MKIVEYAPGWFDALRSAVSARRPDSALNHRPFVDYYYATRDWCRLLLAVNRNDEVIGTLGFDRMRFETEAGEMELGFNSNYNSFVPGVGTFLFMRRLKDCPLGIVFWTTRDTQDVIKSLGWQYFGGIRRHYVNYAYPAFAGDAAWRRLAKNVLRRLPKKRLGTLARRLKAARDAGIAVRPEASFTDDLLPASSPFDFRFAPDVDYLNWRYDPGLSFVRYRLFRILSGDDTVGYVVINEQSNRLVVAQCDGVDPDMLAYGVLSSIVETGKHDPVPRSVMLTSSHPRMQAIYRKFSFRTSGADERFAIGGYRQEIPLQPDTSSWLVNFDWGNNELQTPFLDQRRQDNVD